MLLTLPLRKGTHFLYIFASCQEQLSKSEGLLPAANNFNNLGAERHEPSRPFPHGLIPYHWFTCSVIRVFT